MDPYTYDLGGMGKGPFESFVSRKKNSSIENFLNGNSGAASASEQQTVGDLTAAIGYAFLTAGAYLLGFTILRFRLTRIYRPRTYLVPERERVSIPPRGIVAWVKPIFATPGLEIIKKCGLDAYFFLRYLRMLLKIFLPMAIVILPILLPINRYSKGEEKGLNILSITNVGHQYTRTRLWPHLLLAIGSILWVCYVVYKELRGYIRVRQAHLSSPQHRIRASATTVLVQGIPRKWLTIEALDGLYDVFPGGIRNIWINRNYDELSNKISIRDDIAKSLESAECNLIARCRKVHMKAAGKDGEKAARELTPVSNGRSQEKRPLSPVRDRAPTPPPKASDEMPLRDNVESAVETAAENTTGAKGQTHPDLKENPNQELSSSKWAEKLQFWRHKDEQPKEEYPSALSKDFDEDADEGATWRQYIEPQGRETMRLPIVNQTWFPALPLVGKKVDRIYYLRRELARLNLEIEADQKNVEKYPLMNSAFIQFNHQVAAHMACQAVNHHVPLHMAPRLVEISPEDVLWDNMSIKWWERYVRSFLVLAMAVGLIILYAVPVTFTSLLANISTLTNTVHWLGWLQRLPVTVKSLIQGPLPPLLLSLILVVIPPIFRLLVKIQGVPTGNAREKGVQMWYFAFLFIQVFLVVTISSGLLNFFRKIANDPAGTATLFASTMPKAANYFFSYMTIQSLSSSGSAIFQTITLLLWFLWAPITDSTPRQKWRRQTSLSKVQWGSFFPPFTNYAVITIVYSVIAPLMLVFGIVVFAIFWIVYRYNILYVYQFRTDTGGLLFPTGVNQLFTGVYTLEIALIGFFFLQRDEKGKVSCVPHAIIMIVAFAATIAYQWLLNDTFRHLFRYLPITLEDDAVIRDQEFARAQASRFAADRGEQMEGGLDSFQDELEEREKNEARADKEAEEQEKRDIEERRRSRTPGPGTPGAASTPGQDSLHKEESSFPWRVDRWRQAAMKPVQDILSVKPVQDALKPVQGVLDLTGRAQDKVEQNIRSVTDVLDRRLLAANGLAVAAEGGDVEAQQKTVADVLYSGIADELEDLTPEERDILVRYAFQHSALRSRRPIIWIPQDDLGVSDDEIRRAKKMSEHISMSNDGAHVTEKGKIVFQKSPPDLSSVDLITL